jgi:small-conductance mechanosensitive channel
MFSEMFEDVDWVAVLTALGVVAVVAYITAEAAARMVRSVLAAVVEGEDPVSLKSPIVRRPIRIVRATVFLAALAALAPPALDVAGVTTRVGIDSAVLGVWLLGSGIRIAIIAVLAYTVIRIIGAMAGRIEAEIAHEPSPDTAERLKRARTITRLARNALSTIVVAAAFLMALRELNVDITPILTGAGILGLAVGFGAQTLVKDLIAGFFLTLENQIRIGDVAVINGTGGMVEKINLRTIVLRDFEGVVHVFPNGSIERLANRTKDFSYYVIDLGVAYKEDTDRVVEVLHEVGAELRADPKFAPNILEPLEVVGVDDFGESEVVIKLRIKTLPLKQWETGRELRRRIKKAFDARQIEIPFPHRTLYFGDASRPFQVERVDGADAAAN